MESKPEKTVVVRNFLLGRNPSSNSWLSGVFDVGDLEMSTLRINEIGTLLLRNESPFIIEWRLVGLSNLVDPLAALDCHRFLLLVKALRILRNI